MFVLGIETATRVAGAAVVNEDRLVAERFVHNRKTHSQILLPMIQQVLDDAGITPRELAGVAVSCGPGSFTGLRIGMAAAKSMAQVLQVPAAGVPTLEALAWNAAGVGGLICPILDARKQEVYTCLYKSDNGVPVPVTDPRALSLAELKDLLASLDEQVTLLGDGVPVYGEEILQALGQKVKFAGRINLFSRAAGVAELGRRMIEEGLTGDPLTMQPSYIRRPEAEVTWERKHRAGEK
jgi:tRNA threonylcarbamoyladenosine biosynthesis protein TsaB